MTVEAPRFTTLTARTVALPRNDIDTDQIIPARFLKVTDKLGLGQKLFCDWRYLEDGDAPHAGDEDASGLTELPPQLYGRLAALALV